jgi:hypothetical protein
MNPSAPGPKDPSLLSVRPEACLVTPSFETGLRATERVKTKRTDTVQRITRAI